MWNLPWWMYVIEAGLLGGLIYLGYIGYQAWQLSKEIDRNWGDDDPY